MSRPVRVGMLVGGALLVVAVGLGAVLTVLADGDETAVVEPPRPDPPGPKVVDRALRSAVSVRARGCRVETTGSGTVLAEGVVTNAHVVAGAEEIVVTTPGGAELPAELRAFDEELDLALLVVPGLDVDPLRPGDPATGTEAVALVPGDDEVLDAVPVAIERTITIVTSDIYGDGRYERRGIELRADIAPGDSGAGVIDGRGEVVGVVFSASRRTSDVAYAISGAELADFVATRAEAPVPGGECVTG